MLFGNRQIGRAHSFPWTMEFRDEPRNLGFYKPSCTISHGIHLFAAEFDVFHSNNFFLRKLPQSSSVTSLLTLIFGLMVTID